MAQIPPWLDVTPGLFTQAMESGTRAGLELANLNQRGQEFAQEQAFKTQEEGAREKEAAASTGLAQQRLGLEASEGAAERALRANLSQHQMELAQEKFNTQTSLREAGQEIARHRLANSALQSELNRRDAEQKDKELRDYQAKVLANQALTREETARYHTLMLEKSRGGGGPTISAKLQVPNAPLWGGPDITLHGSPSSVYPYLSPDAQKLFPQSAPQTNAPAALSTNAPAGEPLPPPDVQPLPDQLDNEHLTKGQVYDTPKGVLRWDGTNFVKLTYQ